MLMFHCNHLKVILGNEKVFLNNDSDIVVGDESNLNYNVDVSLQSFVGNLRGMRKITM